MSTPNVPSVSVVGGLKEFKFWCQKVLPTVYDDSLSYYEAICKMVNKLNDVVELYNTSADNFNQLVAYLNELKDYLDARDAKVDEDIAKLYQQDADTNALFTRVTGELAERMASLERRTANLEVSIADIVGATVFATVDDMVNTEIRLDEGSYVTTRGYYEVGDGGEMVYEYSSSDSDIAIVGGMTNQGYFNPVYKSDNPLGYGMKPDDETFANKNSEMLDLLDEQGFVSMLDFRNKRYYFNDVNVSTSGLLLKDGEFVVNGEFDLGETGQMYLENIKMSTNGYCDVYGTAEFSGCLFTGADNTFRFNVNGNSVIKNCRFNCNVRVEGNAQFVDCVFDTLDVTAEASCVINGYSGSFVNCGFFNGDTYASTCVKFLQTNGEYRWNNLVMIGCYGGATTIVANGNPGDEDTEPANLDILYDSIIDIDDGMVGADPFANIVGMANFHGLCYGYNAGGEISQTYPDLQVTGLRPTTELLYYHPFNEDNPASLPSRLRIGINRPNGTIIKDILPVGQLKSVKIVELSTNTTLYDSSDESYSDYVRIDTPCVLEMEFLHETQDGDSYVTAVIS